MAPLLGLLSLLCSFWFLIVMPIIMAAFAWQDRRMKKRSIGLIVAVVMLIVFYISAGLIWRLGTADWKLSFLSTLEASMSAEKYGHAVESRAERMVVWLVIYSTTVAGIAGGITAAVRCSLNRRQRARCNRGNFVRDNPAM